MKCTMDIGDLVPHRGDRMRTSKTLYYILSATPVKRRDPQAGPRYTITAVRAEELSSRVRSYLLRSAMRTPEGSRLIEFRWYPRKKKTTTFEQLMRTSRG